MADLAELLRAGDKNAVVSDIYRNVLGRDVDPSAFAWANNLDVNDPNSVLDLSRQIARSEEGRNYAKGNQGQYNYLAGLSQTQSPFASTETPYANMEYVGPAFSTGNTEDVGHQFKDQNGGIITVDAAGNPIKYAPSASWYDEQLAKNPSALRGTDYRNQVYLAGGPLDRTYNFNGQNVPIEAAEYQVDPQTGQFIKGPTGENKPVEWRPQGYNMWDYWAAPVAVVAVPALAAGATYLAGAYGAGAGLGAAEGVGAGTAAGAGAAESVGAGAAGDVFAGYSATGSAAGTAGSTIPAGAYGAAGSGSWGLSPELASELGLDYSTSGLSTSGELGSQTLNSMGLNSGGLTAMQKAQLVRMGANALGTMFGGGGQPTGGMGGGGSSGYNYASLPFLANPQQNQAYMKTGPDVSGSGTTVAGMPVQLDTTRHNILMANLLRG